jgi:hypothetical protein
MIFEERVRALSDVWTADFVEIAGDMPANEGAAVAVFAAAELFRRLVVGNAVEKWGSIEREISRQFAEALQKGVDGTRSPFN